ncbi:cytochrome p450 [Plakobranchus ocellatus]|uniref:Cytochrome p450 n=1 Tax=Plakobranchus ocellatus TaxID=259542 RepID=A0AAV3Y0E9_9GAST|nr:cytochrome p450 [Plakobranchus ocellatus]
MDWVYTHPNISVVVSVSSLLLWLSVRRPSNIPPNPWFIFPLVGHRPLLRGDPIQTMRRLRSELGEVCGVYIDAQLVIIVSGMAAIREAFMIRGDEFYWRPNTRTCDLFHFGVICNSGKEWREQRRTTEAGIRHISPNIAPLVRKESQHLIQALKNEAGKAFDAQALLHSAVFNALTAVLTSRRMDYKDARVEKAMERYKENLGLFSDSKFPNFFPFQKFLMGDFFDVKFLRINMTEIHQKIINPVYEEHKAEYSADHVLDFLDVYLREMKAHKNVEKTTIEEKSCQAVLYDLLWHGTTTTGATLYWAILYILNYPDVATKARDQVTTYLQQLEESNNLAGGGDTSSSASQSLPELPTFFKAFIHEVQRCANISPISMAHAVAKEKFLKGYRVPGDAVILPNLDSLMMDEDIWGDPQVFRPERFLNSDEKLSVPTEFIPFFIGIRNCPASSIAQNILLTFLIYILYHFDLEPEVEGQIPSMERQKGLIPMPKDFKVKFIPRR